MTFGRITDVIAELNPRGPAYCIYPHVVQRDVRRFVDGFPGRVLYAVKANPEPRIVQQVQSAGVEDFDVASLEEMELVHGVDAAARCYFMAPVRMRGAVQIAYTAHGVRHYVVDHTDELRRVVGELPTNDAVIFVRMGALNPDATYNLSEKFGATPDETVALLREIDSIGMEPALAFNTGSLVRRPGAFVDALERCETVLEQAGVRIRLLDVGGGFPSNYPGMTSEPLSAFFDTIDETRRQLPMLSGLELLAEPGRALIAGGLSLLLQVLHRNGTRLYLNDGVWGSLMEPVLSKGELRYPYRAYRHTEPIGGDTIDYEVFGPTCDSMDRLPAPLPLPADLRAGDWLEFGTAGAYSLSNRTHFNGFYPDTFVELANSGCEPPAADDQESAP